AKQNTCRLSARKSLDRLRRIVTAEKHLSKQPAQRLLPSKRIELRQPVDHRRLRFFVQFMLLRKIAETDLVSPANCAAIHAKMTIRFFNQARRIPNQRPQQRRLPHTVSAEQSDFFAAINIRCKSVDYLQIAIGFFDALEFQRMASRRFAQLKLDKRPLNV